MALRTLYLKLKDLISNNAVIATSDAFAIVRPIFDGSMWETWLVPPSIVAVRAIGRVGR